jgi:TPR repeat protein
MQLATPSGMPTPTLAMSGDELFQLGLRYSIGHGGTPRDAIAAHMLFNLAALRGSVEAKIYRKELADEMEPAALAEAQRAAREWLARG